MPRGNTTTITVQGIPNLAPIGPDLYQILDPEDVKSYGALLAEEPGVLLDRDFLDVHLTHLPLLGGWDGSSMPPHHQPVPPPSFSASWWNELRPYQKESIWIMRGRTGSLLLSAMGSGKTRTALGASDFPAIVFCPKSAIQVWEDEVEYAGLRSFTLSRRAADLSIFEQAGAVDVWILPWSVAGAWAGFFASVGLGPTVRTKIGDEFHEIQKAQTQASRGWRVIDAERKIGLTATPLRNRLKSLWSLLDGVQPKAWGGFFDFRKKYCAATEGEFGWEDGTPSDVVLVDLRKRLTNVAIKRNRSELGLDIPPLTREIHTVELSNEVRAALLKESLDQVTTDRFQSEESKKGVKLAWTTAMRQRVGMLKAQETPAILKRLLPAWRRAVVWVWHKEVADYLQDYLVQHDIALVDKIVGVTVAKTRKKILREWRDGDPFPTMPQVLIASIGACSSAVSFLTSGLCVFVEADYAPLQMVQAEARTHRPFQKHGECLALYLSAGPGTIDHNMMEILIEKAEESERVFGSDGQVDQMQALLGGGVSESDQDFMARVAERMRSTK